jgi:hypothetical protein
MDENLVGYLLKVLEPEEQSAVEAHLEGNADARGKVELLERVLAPLAADAEGPTPPSGLTLATLARIAEHKCRPAAPPPAPPRTSLAPTGGWLRLRRADVFAAAALLVIVGGLALPILLESRKERDRVECENNLRTVWGALAEYSGRTPDQAFPMVEEHGPKSVAGAFVPILHDAGLLTDTHLVNCPARPVQAQPTNVTLADLESAYKNDAEDFARLGRDLAGGYAYSLGYRNGQQLVGLHATDPGTLPILADLPAGGGNSLNHGGSGQNVLYIGGNVRWCVLRTVGESGDDIYVNKHNFLRAGEGRSDTVLGPGDARPADAPE